MNYVRNVWMVLVGKSCPIKHCYTVMDLCTYERTSHDFIVFINIEFLKLCLQCHEMLSGLQCHQGCFCVTSLFRAMASTDSI